MLVDSSALIALLDADDHCHAAALDRLAGLRVEPLLTHNYVVLETVALLQPRLGLDAVHNLTRELLAPVRVRWVDQTLHEAAIAALLASGQRRVSLVDQVSFELMRRERIETAFAFDAGFERAGLATVP